MSCANQEAVPGEKHCTTHKKVKCIGWSETDVICCNRAKDDGCIYERGQWETLTGPMAGFQGDMNCYYRQSGELETEPWQDTSTETIKKCCLQEREAKDCPSGYCGNGDSAACDTIIKQYCESNKDKEKCKCFLDAQKIYNNEVKMQNGEDFPEALRTAAVLTSCKSDPGLVTSPIRMQLESDVNFLDCTVSIGGDVTMSENAQISQDCDMNGVGSGEDSSSSFFSFFNTLTNGGEGNGTTTTTRSTLIVVAIVVGGLIVLGLLIAFLNWILGNKNKKKTNA